MNYQDITTISCTLRSSCLVGFLLDECSFSPKRLQTILSASWELWGQIQILGKDGKFYVIHFDNDEDRKYICANSPWAVQGAFLSVFHWRLNLRLHTLRVLDIAVWIQIQGLPLDYHHLNFAEYVGAMVGPVDWVDWPNGFPRNLRFIRMRVWFNPQDPLLMGFLLRLDSSACVWLQIRYERVFRIFFSCGRIGHKADTCIWIREQIESSIRRQMRRIRTNFNIPSGVNFNEAHFVNSA